MTAIVARGDAGNLHLPDETVDLIVTSPPYFGLRSYVDGGQHYAGQVGDEATPTEYLDALMACTDEWMRVLKPTGSIFVNLGDKYSTYEHRPENVRVDTGWAAKSQRSARYTRNAPLANGVPYKSLMMLPAKFAIRCIEAGYVVRQEIVWSKNAAMPTRLTDRTRRTHEHVFHVVKSQTYFSNMRGLSADLGLESFPPSVWEIPTVPFRAPVSLGISHSAAYPPELVRRIVMGWAPEGGVVLDPFGGTGTTAMVASVLGRVGISVDLSADYCRLAQWRTTDRRERDRVLGIERPVREVVPDGQLGMFEGIGA